MFTTTVVAPSNKKRTNLSLDQALLLEAKQVGINLSQAAEVGIAKAIVQKKQQLWLAQNQAAIESSNCFTASQGLPLAKFRNF